MRPLRSMLLFVLVVFIGGALLAPWLYWLAQKLAPNDVPFHRYVNRSLIVLALLGLYPLLRGLGAKSWREIGLVAPAGQWGRLLNGFLLGFGSLAVLTLINLAAHGRAYKHALSVDQLVVNALQAAAAGVGVSLFEEILFRGIIFSALDRVRGWRFALLFSSMIYAIVHFMQSAHQTGPVVWTSGLELLPKMLRGFADWNAVIPGFLNLTLAGILLGLAYHRTGTLYFSIGIHAGWIFWLRFYSIFTMPVNDAPVWLYGTNKLIDGWLTPFVLLLALAIMVRLPVAKSKPVTT